MCRNRKKLIQPGLAWSRKVHRFSGYIIALPVMLHVIGTRIMPMLEKQATDSTFATAYLQEKPFLKYIWFVMYARYIHKKKICCFFF